MRLHARNNRCKSARRKTRHARSFNVLGNFPGGMTIALGLRHVRSRFVVLAKLSRDRLPLRQPQPGKPDGLRRGCGEFKA